MAEVSLDTPHLTLNDMVYLAGVCVHGLHVGGGDKAGSENIANTIASQIVVSSNEPQDVTFYVGEVLHRLVQARLPEMVAYDQQTPEYSEQMMVDENQLFIAANLSMKPICYKSAMYEVTQPVADMLEQIYVHQPALVQGTGWNSDLQKDTDGEIIRQRMNAGNFFFAHVEEQLTLEKRRRDPTKQEEPPKPENIVHSFFHNVKTLFGFFKKENAGENPKKNRGPQHGL